MVAPWLARFFFVAFTVVGTAKATTSGSGLAAGAAQLAGFGKDVDVVEPVAVRDQLASIGRQLVDVYSKRT